jgi:tetratricopeptide (TPR) repeat protein
MFPHAELNSVHTLSERDKTTVRKLYSPGSWETAWNILVDEAAQGNPVAQTTLGSAYSHGCGVKKDHKNAIFWWKKAAQSGNTVAQRTLALACISGADYNGAIIALNEAVRSDPKDVDAYVNRGLAYRKLGQNQKAIDDCTKALGLDPRYADAYVNRGVAYGQLGQHQKTIADCTKALEFDPECADAYVNRGVAYGNLGQYQKELDDWQASRFSR